MSLHLLYSTNEDIPLSINMRQERGLVILKKDQRVFLCKEARIPCQWAERESSTFHEYLSYYT